MNEEPIMLFDGVCNLCNGVVQLIINIDKRQRFRFTSLQSESGQQLLREHGLPTTDFNSFVLIKGNRYFTKSSAVLNIAKELGGGWQLFYALIVLPKPLRDWVYDLVAKWRYKIFGKTEACMVPTPELKQRFLP